MLRFFGKLLVLALFFAAAFVSSSCVETERPTDSNLSGTGGPKDWETGLPGMGSVVPENR